MASLSHALSYAQSHVEGRCVPRGAVSLPVLYKGEFLCRFLYTVSYNQFLYTVLIMPNQVVSDGPPTCNVVLEDKTATAWDLVVCISSKGFGARPLTLPQLSVRAAMQPCL